jgi:hypothetical protein
MSDFKLFNEEIELLRINNDVDGNPRYVIHFIRVGDRLKTALGDLIKDYDLYMMSLNASGGGFKKYHNKSYDGGIVFQSYNIQSDLKHLENNVNDFIAKTAKKLKLN